MMSKNNYWISPNFLGEPINKQWTRVESSPSNNLKSVNSPDQLIEEEQETFPREINYLPSDKSSYLCFNKNGFNAGKSREGLTNPLNNCHEEVLKNFVVKYGKKQIKRQPWLHNQSELVNYVTKIIVSKPKCHVKHCKCQVGDRNNSEGHRSSSVEEPKSQKHGNESTSSDAILSHKPDLKASGKKNARAVTSKIQTDPWNQVGCSCNCRRNYLKIGKSVDTQASVNETLLKIDQFNPSKKNEKKEEAEPILLDTTVMEMTSSSNDKTSNKQTSFKIRNEPQNTRKTEPKPQHTIKEYAYEGESKSQAKKGDCQTSSDSGTMAQVSPRCSKEEFKLSYKVDDASKGDRKVEGPQNNAKETTESKKQVTCNKCRRVKRGYDSGGHNIIVSNCPRSHGTVLIKMQSRDTSRQFDRIMAELNYQKSEIKRLNDMYQKMVENNGSQKFTGSRLLSEIYKGETPPNSIQPEESVESNKGQVNLFGDSRSDEEEVLTSRLQSQANFVDADIEDGEPQMKEAKLKFRSRVLVWLKRPWINLKQRSEKCRRRWKSNEARVYVSQVFNFCQNTAKGAAMSTWKFVKKKFQ